MKTTEVAADSTPVTFCLCLRAKSVKWIREMMAPACRKIRYKERRSRKVVLEGRKSVERTSGTASEEDPRLWYSGEGEYEEFPEKMVGPPEEEMVVRLREWVRRRRFLPQDLSDDFLTVFLSAGGYVVEAAGRQLEKYFYSRQEPSPLFRDRDPLSPGNVRIFEWLYVLPLPDTTDDGRKIIVTGLVKPTRRYSQMEHAKALAMVLDLLIWENDFGFGDFVVVFDARGFECPQLLENKVYSHRSIKSLLLDTIPGTLRSFYFFYPPPHVANVADTRDGIWITVVRNKQEMRAHLPADILPLEYGGNLGHLGDLLVQWQVHMVQSRDFFVHFERRMARDYQRKLCYEKEVTSRGKNWVHRMKLEADEWEYKIRYYERMRDMTPLRHPGFGSQRALHVPAKPKATADGLSRCRQQAKKEEEDAKVFEPPKLYNGYAKEIRQARLAAAKEQLERCLAASPIRELQIYYS